MVMGDPSSSALELTPIEMRVTRWSPTPTPSCHEDQDSHWCNGEKCYYGLLAAAGLFFCTTVILTIALILIVCRRRSRAKQSKSDRTDTTTTAPATAKRKDSSYWIECELDNSPREFHSTPNLSDWSSPPITRTFFPPSPDNNFPTSERKTIVPSASMAPLVPPQRRVERPLRVSTSHMDLSTTPKNSKPAQDMRLSPISPPVFPKKSPTPSTGEETPKAPRRKKKKRTKKFSAPDQLPLETSGGEADLTSSTYLQYVHMHKIPPTELSPAVKSKTPSPLYQQINVVTRDPTPHYETVGPTRRK